ncbi:hypothetical protein ACFVAJ_18820 [Agromyces sp. NPDC057679]|uniref:hypothetical protein n=1 Tax=Agromyces sp. NPDC057679 TaxID=3346207 RepID=UPI00366E1020
MANIDLKGNHHDRKGLFSEKPQSAAPAGLLTAGATPDSDGVYARFDHEEAGRATIVSAGEAGEFVLQTFGANVQFSAPETATADQLQEAAAEAYDRAVDNGLTEQSADDDDMEEFVRGYLVTALWSGTDEDGEPLDSTFDVDDFDPETVKTVTEELDGFVRSNRGLVDRYLEAGNDWSQLGNDLNLTRNRHGAGFWDRGLGELGTDLTDMSHASGSADLYTGDDGKLHFA